MNLHSATSKKLVSEFRERIERDHARASEPLEILNTRPASEVADLGSEFFHALEAATDIFCSPKPPPDASIKVSIVLDAIRRYGLCWPSPVIQRVGCAALSFTYDSAQDAGCSILSEHSLAIGAHLSPRFTPTQTTDLMNDLWDFRRCSFSSDSGSAEMQLSMASPQQLLLRNSPLWGVLEEVELTILMAAERLESLVGVLSEYSPQDSGVARSLFRELEQAVQALVLLVPQLAATTTEPPSWLEVSLAKIVDSASWLIEAGSRLHRGVPVTAAQSDSYSKMQSFKESWTDAQALAWTLLAILLDRSFPWSSDFADDNARLERLIKKDTSERTPAQVLITREIFQLRVLSGRGANKELSQRVNSYLDATLERLTSPVRREGRFVDGLVTAMLVWIQSEFPGFASECKVSHPRQIAHKVFQGTLQPPGVQSFLVRALASSEQ